MQAIAPKRGNDTTNENTFDRLLSCLLTEMDGIKYKTNHIDMVKEHGNVDRPYSQTIGDFALSKNDKYLRDNFTTSATMRNVYYQSQ